MASNPHRLNKYNTLAAVLAAQQLSIDEVCRNTIANFQAAFDGRELTVNGKRWILLSKNPVDE